MAEASDAARQLLDLAADDEFMAKSLLPIEGVTDAGLGFHTQQAVEKALKAVLALNEIEFPFTHDLDGLLDLCEKSEIEVSGNLSGVGRLSVFAVRLRYGASPATHLDRDKALAWAAEAVAWARSVVDEADPKPKLATEPGDSGQTPTRPS
jgi:HEPN domain-containing protein